MLGDEVGEGAEAAGLRAGVREVERAPVLLEGVGELVDAGRRRDAGDRHHGGVALPEGAQRGAEVAAGTDGDLAQVGLGHHQHVGDLHDPGLDELQRVAAAGLDDDGDGVGGLGHLGLGLADAHGLDHHDVERGCECLGGGPGGGGEAAEPLPGRGGADEQAAVGGVGFDPRAVAEQRAAGALGGRVDGEHRDGAAPPAPGAGQRAQQRRLAGARRAGDADHVGGRLAAELRGRDLGEQRGDLLPPRGGAVLDQVQRGGRRGQVALAQAGAELGAAHAAAASTPLRSATSLITSPMIRVSSKSLGV